MPVLTPDYVSPRWAPDAHLQTVIPAKLSAKPRVQYRRELIDMPDGDFMTFDWVEPVAADPLAPTVVHFHGLEGSSESHYALALMAACVALACTAGIRGRLAGVTRRSIVENIREL